MRNKRLQIIKFMIKIKSMRKTGKCFFAVVKYSPCSRFTSIPHSFQNIIIQWASLFLFFFNLTFFVRLFVLFVYFNPVCFMLIAESILSRLGK